MKEITEKRKKSLIKNFKKIFWIRALMNVKVINAVMSLFYLHRGISLSQIFYLSIFWSAANLLLEVPSSYLADRWGRKKTLFLGVIFGGFYWIVYIFAHSFGAFAFGTALYAASIAFLSGTDEALLYDSAKELGQQEGSLKKLGSYHAAQKIFKCIAPVIGVLLARDLKESQFVLILLIDVVATLFALYLTGTLTEANHYEDVEKIEAGVMHDAWKLLTKNKDLMNGMMSRVLLFIATLVTWHYYQAFYTDLGIPLLALGIGWALNSFVTFLSHMYIVQIVARKNIRFIIDIFNLITTLTIGFFLIAWFFFPGPYILYSIFLLFFVFENMRLPVYSEFFNKASHSYNRATTLSLANFLKSLLDIPIMLLAGILIGINVVYPYVIAFALGIVTLLFFRLKNTSSQL